MADTEIDSFTDWSDLPKELLDLILSKMPSISIYNFRAVCSSWRSAAKAYIASPSCSMLHEVPWLMLPPEEENDEQENNDKMSFYNLDEKRVYTRLGRPKEFDNSLCLGSSYGWLVMLDEKADPYLFNPFTLVRIRLPLIATYPDVFCVYKSGDDDGYKIEYARDYTGEVGVQTFDSVHRLRRSFIMKAVLSSDPSHNNFFVLMIFVFGSYFTGQLAFCHSGDSKWVRLGEMSNGYADVICYEDKFIALNGDVVEFWEINDSSPVKVSELRVAERPESSVCLPEWDLVRNYVVESSGDLLLIERFLNCFNLEMRKTLVFRIFKLNFTTKKWEGVESLGDCVLFLGCNQSKSVSIPGNSIYFTDDEWDLYDYRMDYDVGVFNVEDKSFKSFYQSGIPQKRTEPPPFWIDPVSFLMA